ncbi:MAG: D-alanyl-D-alanine carboxypeptidase, partial [Clostridia bacterium]|nr:D-alanyl-D-alanine carboxypeptidase [Clostridia bacterium]
ASANDGAVALAEHLAGSESAFVDRMNERASQLGMTNTLFLNPTGLDDNCDPYSTARDVAIMSRELLKHESILEYTTIWTDSIRGGAFGLANTNKLVRFYSGANGLKTGSTSKAKFCVSAAAKRDGMQLVAVVLGGETSAERFEDAKTLLNFGFAGYAVFDPPEPEQKEVKVWGGKTDHVVPVCPTPSLLTEKSLKNSLSSRVEIADELFAPVAKGQVIGKIVYEAEGKTVKEIAVTSRDAVEKADAGFIFRELFRRVCLG